MNEAEASVIPYIYKNDKRGNPLPVSFEEGLKVLMPRVRKGLRMARFLDYLNYQYGEGKYEGNEAYAAHRREFNRRFVESMREEGTISEGTFDMARRDFRQWEVRSTSEKRRIAGKKGADGKKLPQRKGSDAAKPKRQRKARPPVGEMKKILSDF